MRKKFLILAALCLSTGLLSGCDTTKEIVGFMLFGDGSGLRFGGM